MKVITVVAGPNGSGKSNLLKQLWESGTLTDEDGPYVCADDFALQLQEDNSVSDARKIYDCARQEVLRVRQELVDKGKNFILETVLSHPSHLDFLQSAKQKGYAITAFYIATDSADINVKRVEKRVQQGGHNVEEEKTRSRYVRSLSLLPELLALCDTGYIYDNSGVGGVLCARKEAKKVTVYNASHVWVMQAIETFMKM